MIIENALYCQEFQHQKSPLIAICLNQNCQAASGLCISCFPNHTNHNNDLQTIDNIRQKLEAQIQQLKQSYSICEEIIQLMNLIKMEITLIVQNIQSIQKMSNHEDITKVKQILINSITTKEDTSITIKTQKELIKAKEILNDLKMAIEFSQSNLTDGQQQEFQEYLKQANQVYVQGKYQQAKDLYCYCVKLDPTNINSKWRIGMCLKMLGIYDKAIQVFDQIINVNPNFVDAICHKADSLRLQGKYEEALSYFDKTLLLDDKNFVALSYKGETLRKMQRYLDSLVFFEKALVINPKNAVTLFGKGDSLRCLRRYDESLTALNQGEQIDPNNALIQYSKGYALKAKGQIQEAIQSFQRCVVINPQYKNSLEKELASLTN